MTSVTIPIVKSVENRRTLIRSAILTVAVLFLFIYLDKRHDITIKDSEHWIIFGSVVGLQVIMGLLAGMVSKTLTIKEDDIDIKYQ